MFLVGVMLFFSTTPVYALTPIAVSAGLNTTTKPWFVWVFATSISNQTLKAQLIDTNGKIWATDIRTSYYPNYKVVGFLLPANSPPSGCNVNKTCTVKVRLITSTGALSNAVNLKLNSVSANPTPVATPKPTTNPPSNGGKVAVGVNVFSPYFQPSGFATPYQSLQPHKYHYLLPFYANITGEDSADIWGDNQDAVDKQIQFASAAGINFFPSPTGPALAWIMG